VFSGILHRAIFGELAKVFLLSLVGITGLIVMAAIVVEASQHGLSPVQILAAIPLIVPSMMPFIIPPTTLFAACVVYGRLAHDNEITAIKSAGINIMHVVWPGIFLGLGMSLSTFGLYYYLIPHTHLLLRTAVVNDIEEFLYALLKRDHEIRRVDLKLNYEMWVEQVQGRQLKNAIFKRRDAKGRYDVIAKAREADLHVDMNRHEVLVHMRHGQVLDEYGNTRLHFEDKTYSVPLPEGERNYKPSPRDMTWTEILENRSFALAQEEQLEKVIGAVNNGTIVVPSVPERARQLHHLKGLRRAEHQHITQLNAELHLRPAQAFGCLFFVLVGCPVGIWFSRSDYLSAFITCFLPIAFIYYPLQLCCTNLVKDGKMSAMLGSWSANLVMGVIALALFRKLLKN
jgi:lipopolysaccharide export system permease protein